MQPIYSGGSGSSQGAVSRVEFLRTTYLYLAGAIVAFAFASFVLNILGIGALMLKAMSVSRFVWLAVLGAFMIAGRMASGMADNGQDNSKQLMGLGFYVLAEALIFSPMFAYAQVVAPSTIPAAAFVTLMLCGGLTWTAFTTKSDFSFLGGILKIGGMVAMGVILFSVIFGASLGLWFSAIMIVFAGGCVLYDTAQIIHHYPTDRPAGAALHLFASVALMLWYVLSLLLKLSGRD